jgi:hypothetical protein
MADPIGKPDQEIWGRSHLQSEIDSKIVLAPSSGAITKADPLEVDPTVK